MAEVTAGRPMREVSNWAIGWTGFAGFMLIMIGVFHIMIGISGILSGQVFVSTPNYVFAFNATTWGWIHLIGGIAVAAAGFGVFSANMLARVLGVAMAILSMIINFAFLPLYPVWSVLIIAVDVAVIWALTAHGRDILAAG